ncbi:hypothetical protein [Halomonas cerina]|uniref:Uncharacterized protein n=1 Tax=Halomonas cerina TaxID=447424 RepID=A0A839V5D4_9GAMM|nr:hypothetical protein [Halomonas cerina]MBB3190602.1 hypothetical protein [Halomonas cerina]
MDIIKLLDAISKGQWVLAVIIFATVILVLLFRYDPWGLGSKLRIALKIPIQGLKPHIKIDIYCPQDRKGFEDEVAVRLINDGNVEAIVRTSIRIIIEKGFGNYEGDEIYDSDKRRVEGKDEVESIPPGCVSYFNIRHIIRKNSTMTTWFDLVGAPKKWLNSEIKVEALAEYWDKDKIRSYNTPAVSGIIGWSEDGAVVLDSKRLPR